MYRLVLHMTEKAITVKLSRRLASRLSARAKNGHRTQSAVVRDALERYLADGSDETEPSFLELAQDLAGCLEGPANLSSDRRRLRAYGR